MARRVIQFPVRNAFTPRRPSDALARETEGQAQAHRIAEQVEGEISRLAARQATGARRDFEEARKHGVVVMHAPTRLSRLRKHLATLKAKLLRRP